MYMLVGAVSLVTVLTLMLSDQLGQRLYNLDIKVASDVELSV